MRLLQLFLFFFLATNAMAQIVNIPDPKFKNALINTKCDYSVFYDPDDVDKNNNGEIEVEEARWVQILYLPGQGITSLTGIEAFTKIHRLDCANNQLSNLNYTFPAVFDSLNCSNNPLDTLDLSTFTNLIYLGCNRLNLDTLSLVALTNLRTLECTGNRLKYLDLRAQATLLWFDCSGNQLREMYLKNGQRQYEMKFANNPALRYICCDSTELSAVQDSVTKYGLSNCTVSTFCAPGSDGKVYTVQGRALLDLNGNGCDTADRAFAYLPLRVASSSDVGDFLANASGNFSFSLPAGSYTITPRVEQPAYFQVTPLSITLPEPTDTLTTAFCISANGTYPDLEVTLVPLAVVRPGFETSYRIGYKNKGTTVQSGNLVVEYDDDQFDFVSASQPVKSQSAGTATWDFSNLAPLQERHFDLVLRAHTPVQISPLQLGDTVVLTARIESAAQDASPADNTFELTQIAVGSYDPNDKTCLQGPVLLPEAVGKDYLHYLIRFENTGTFAAENVVVLDTLDTQVFDLSTLYVVGASHSMSTRLTQNRVEFSFPNIQLPFDDANNDGYVLFKIKTKPNLPIGTLLKNRAGIYFDFNAPIITNVAETVVDNKNDPVIFIPDSLFRDNLLYREHTDIKLDGNYVPNSRADRNGDRNIQLSEALAVEGLDLSDNIRNLQGIEFFKNVTHLQIEASSISKLDLRQLKKLQYLECVNIKMQELLLPDSDELQELYCANNALTRLYLRPTLMNLRHLNCSSNQLTELNLPQNTAELLHLNCSSNRLTNLNLSGNLSKLEFFSCEKNRLKNLNTQNASNLAAIYCGENLIDSLSFNPLSLVDLRCQRNRLTRLNLQNAPKINQVFCYNNLLEELTFDNNTTVSQIYADSNHLSVLYVDSMPYLYVLYCSFNNLTELSVHKNNRLYELSCRFNQLRTLNLKNEAYEQVYFAGNPDLAYICCDEGEQKYIGEKIIEASIPDCVFNTYCNETVMGPLSIYRGKVQIDVEMNGCEDADVLYPYLKLTHNTLYKYSDYNFSSFNGLYYVESKEKGEKLHPFPENFLYFKPTAPLPAVEPYTYDTILHDFCLIQRDTVHYDMESVILPVTQAVPGNTCVYKVIAKNKGTITQSGTFSLSYNPQDVTFVQAIPAPNLHSNGTLTWNFSNLRPFESSITEITFDISSSEIRPGDNLVLSAAIQTNQNDDTPRDNSFKLVQSVSATEHTNDIVCLNGSYISTEKANLDYIYYMIRYESNSKDTIQNLPIVTTLDPLQFDRTSTEIVGAEPPARVLLKGQRLEFFIRDYALSHQRGYVAFKIKPAKPFVDTLLKNTALIHFSPSQPIRTNEAITIIRPTVGTQHIGEAGRMRVYPNPAGEQVYFNSSEPVEQVCIFDAAGRLFKCVENNPVYIITKDWPSGVYSARIWSGGHLYVARIVK